MITDRYYDFNAIYLPLVQLLIVRYLLLIEPIHTILLH